MKSKYCNLDDWSRDIQHYFPNKNTFLRPFEIFTPENSTLSINLLKLLKR